METKDWHQDADHLQIVLQFDRLCTALNLRSVLDSPDNHDHDHQVDDHDDSGGYHQDVITVSLLHPTQFIFLKIFVKNVRNNTEERTRPAQH